MVADKDQGKWCMTHVNAGPGSGPALVRLPLLTALSITTMASSNNANCGRSVSTFKFVFYFILRVDAQMMAYRLHTENEIAAAV